MKKETSRMLTGIFIGIAIIIVVLVIGRMSYDSGFANGKITQYNSLTSCLKECGNRDGNQVCYSATCYDLCLSKGNYWGYDHPPFPFPF